MDQRLAEIRRALIAQSPLAGLEEWARTGKPPPAAFFRSYGLSTEVADPDRYAVLRLVRFQVTRTYSFAIPCLEAVQALVALSPLVEIGAGGGYWSAVLKAAGADILATDVVAKGDAGYGFEAAAWTQIEALAADEAVAAHPDRSVFCCWPTEGAQWALEAAARLEPGRVFAIIGEGEGGCTGTDGLWRFLSDHFDLLEVIQIPQFPKVRDRLEIYRRR